MRRLLALAAVMVAWLTCCGGTATAQTVKGQFSVFWFYSPDMRTVSTLPGDCRGMRTSYQIQVRNEAGVIMTLAVLDAGRYKRETSDTDTTVTCDFVYTASVPLRPAYTFVLLEGGDNAQQRDSKTVSPDDVRQHGAPRLSTHESFCPECP